jgi:hypothetical protein
MMKLKYEVIEDSYDDTTHIRTMTEQAAVPSGGWLLRTTLYTPHHITTDVSYIYAKKKKKNARLYDPLV